MNKENIKLFIENGFLLSPDIADEFDGKDSSELLISLKKDAELNGRLSVLNQDLIKVMPKLQEDNLAKIDINWNEFEKARVLIEKGKNDEAYKVFLDLLGYHTGEKKKLDKMLEEVKHEEKVNIKEEKTNENYSSVIVLKEYKDEPKKRGVEDFVEYFKLRYNLIKNLLQSRQELQGLVSINRIAGKQEKEAVALIGIVHDKRTTKNGNIILKVEDPTGTIEVLINKEGKAAEAGKNVVCDEVLGITGVYGGRVIFATQIIFPDVPLTKELKKCDDEACVAFISDLHFGSKLFMKKEFLEFIDWLNGNSGSFLQKRVSSKVKYLFIIGDIVEGVGVYPGQEKELLFRDIMQQYNAAAECISLIRKDIKIIISPGQHDSIRAAEPQPPLDKEFAHALYALPNLIMVSNPCMVNIHSKKDFEGFNVLMYHGASYHYYIDEVDSLRQASARDNPATVIKFLLQKRHLAPTHSSTVYMPNTEEDPFFIDKLPDILVSGEMHRSDVVNYNNVLLINCSCFQGKTSFQEKTGNNPNPGRVPILNLKTREVKIMNFSGED